MELGDHRAVIQLDPEKGMFRGEFLGLNGGADFYADSVSGLQQEGKVSLRIFLEMYSEKGIDPVKHYSGRFVVRLPEEIHARPSDPAPTRLCNFILQCRAGAAAHTERESLLPAL